ncbi:hypothetical protein SteCoe_3770 [Stentor coeruleus]|uniref:Uncharacterized protein n=1 Tax=Stentor coeruleus TaxID=5963 RepID=A0A1R2CWC2_9CILI|nr:hypothetical protein SteCoe_3770 [Stentor coeruleus]
MKEIGPKFAKIGSIALTTLTKELTKTAYDLTSIPFEQEAPKDADHISLYTLNNTKVYIFSQKAAGINLYNILNYIKPERILLQMRPDDVDHLNPKVESCPTKVIPALNMYSDYLTALRKSGFLISKGKEVITGNGNFVHDRFSPQVAVISAIWAMQHNLNNIILADITRKDLYRSISNSTTLMQLQSIYSHINKLIGIQPDCYSEEQAHVPLSLAYTHYPHIWDLHTVKHIAHMTKIYSENTQRIICIANRETGKRLEQALALNPPPVNYNQSLFHTSIIQKEQGESVVEKIALIDCFSYGQNLIEKINNHFAFKRVFEFIKEIVEEERVSGGHVMSHDEVLKRRDFLARLYLARLKRYETVARMKIEEGENKFKAEILKDAARNSR